VPPYEVTNKYRVAEGKTGVFLNSSYLILTSNKFQALASLPPWERPVESVVLLGRRFRSNAKGNSLSCPEK
jgi:hypothetical protein